MDREFGGVHRKWVLEKAVDGGFNLFEVFAWLRDHAERVDLGFGGVSIAQRRAEWISYFGAAKCVLHLVAKLHMLLRVNHALQETFGGFVAVD